MAASHPLRRTYLVDWRFQLKYTALLVVSCGAIMALFGAAIWRELRANSELLEGHQIELGLSGKAVLPRLSDFRDALVQTDNRFLIIILGTALVVATALTLVGILITHRVAGPILVLSRYTEELARGNYPQIRPLRKGDELKNYFEAFRKAVETLRDHQLEEALKLEEIAARSNGPFAEELRALAERKKISLISSPPKQPRD